MSEMTEEQQRENMAKVQESMRTADQVRQGGKLKEGELIDFESLEGNKYNGYVVFKKPSMGDIIKMGGKKSELLKKAGVTDLALVDESIMYISHVISTLDVVCVKRPSWFMKLTEIEEPELLYHIFGRYTEWENSFRKVVPAEPTDDTTATEGTEPVDSSEVRVQRDSTD